MSVFYVDEDDLSIDVVPLSNSERAWIEKFDKLMSQKPSRLMVLEAGDSVSIYDKIVAGNTDLDGNLSNEKGLVLAHCHGATFTINSVSA